jgi:hypothetical protein
MEELHVPVSSPFFQINFLLNFTESNFPTFQIEVVKIAIYAPRALQR